MNSKLPIIAFLFLALPMACGPSRALWPDVDLSGFNPIQGAQDPSNWNLPTAPTYIEYRWSSSYSEEDTVIASSGTKCENATDIDTCVTQFDALTSTEGFSGGCSFDGCSHSYLAFNIGDESGVVGSRSALLEFFGDVDTEAEAVFLASLSYSFGSIEDGDAGIRQVGPDYELLAIRSEMCPYSVTRYLLRIERSGQIHELRSQLIEERDACMVS